MAWKLYEGNCFDYLPLLEDKSIDMILCDLPYGTTDCKWDTPLPLDELWVEYKRVIKDNGAIVLTASQPFTTRLISSNYDMFRYEWIWNKKIPSGMTYAKFQPMRQHEHILIFSLDSTVYNPQMIKREFPIKGGGMSKGETTNNQNKKALKKTYSYKNPITILKFDKIRKDSLHPTQKPVALFEYLIKTYTNENDLVLDNCAGSGTTGVACENLNRNSIMMEKEPEYCQIIKDRMATVQELQLEARKQKTLNEFNRQATLDMPAK